MLIRLDFLHFSSLAGNRVVITGRLRVVSNFGDSGEIHAKVARLLAEDHFRVRARVYFAGMAKIRDHSKSDRDPSFFHQERC